MKFKKINEDHFITIVDKLTRFEPANIRYRKLFDYIINKFYFDTDLKKLTDRDKIEIACNIVNSSFEPDEYDVCLNRLFRTLEEFYFKFNETSYQYLSTRLNIFNLLKKIEINSTLPKNVFWLKKLSESEFSNTLLENSNSSYYPVKKIILCEGQTEYILLGTLFKLFGINFDKFGIYIIPAGGKNQVARKYYKMVEQYKIPFFILLDNDGLQVRDLILNKIRDLDRLYIINSGEFEDLIPVNILLSTINTIHRNDYNCSINDFDKSSGMVENLENICRKYGFGDFKKATFAQNLNKYIKHYCSKDDFNNSEIVSIIDSFLSF